MDMGQRLRPGNTGRQTVQGSLDPHTGGEQGTGEVQQSGGVHRLGGLLLSTTTPEQPPQQAGFREVLGDR
ncbi:hypothetical protein GCM10011401_23430 [Nesterenkonia cremea]|uniref:Uncharacterized protein n=1 Tax=Nesterenkonia cremea TaxID=1882340 RepID=A0A917EST3_9MICC|nr:hypothetical protein GCM10011401_23430 [Nesterenkonia cremea]